MNSRALRVLCLDIEGGFGGSSRSLFESLFYMDRKEVVPEVWCRRDGPVRARYEALGISCRIVEDMPQISALSRFSRNVAFFSAFAARWPRTRAFRNKLAAALQERFDLVHFNHDGLFLLMNELRRRGVDTPMVAHIRTCLSANIFSRWQYRTIAHAADRLVFITENERDNFTRLAGAESEGGAVIYNIAAPPPVDVKAHPDIPRDARFKVAVLSNFALDRGVDRVVEIAELLAARGCRDILFVVAGDMTLRGSLPGELGMIARRGGTLADYAAARGVADMFVFLGHVSAPETILKSCDLLLKPTREDNPWGRDILEALAFGLPVISIGRYDRFVETGKTGFLLPEYASDRVAALLMELDADRELCRRLGAAGATHIAELCDGPSRARDLLAIWQDAARVRRKKIAA